MFFIEGFTQMLHRLWLPRSLGYAESGSTGVVRAFHWGKGTIGLRPRGVKSVRGPEELTVELPPRS